AVLVDAEAREDRAALVAAPEARTRAPRLRPAGDVDARQLDAAGRCGNLAGEHVDQRRLAGAVGPDQRMDLAATQADRHALHRDHAAPTPREFSPSKDGGFAHGCFTAFIGVYRRIQSLFPANHAAARSIAPDARR